MRIVAWCSVVLLFIFKSYCVTEISNETNRNTEIPIGFENTSVASNESDSHSTLIPLSTPVFKGKCEFSTCPEKTYDFYPNPRPCRCDKDCVGFRDCCSDSAFYNEEDQQKSVDIECHQIDNFGCFLKRSCAPSWDDAEIGDKCASAVNHFLDTEAIELRSPVTSSKTNISYANIYCAFCNYELNDAVFWDISVKKCDTTTINRTADFDVNSKNNTTLASKSPIELSFRDLTFRDSSWYYEDEIRSTRYNCSLILIPPSNLQVKYCSRFYAPLIRDCPANWTDEEITGRCLSTHSRVYDWDGTAYRNKYCAYCNGLDDFNITCVPLRLFEESANSDFMRGSFPALKQFTILFDYKLKNILEICNETQKILDKIQTRICPIGKKSETESKPEKQDWFMSALSIYTFFAVLVSLVFLLLHLTVFFVVEELQTIGGKNLASFCTALILAYGSFILSNFFQNEVCYGIAVVIYYSFLSAFFWMLIISFDIWNTIRNATKKFLNPENVKTRFVVYSILAWSMPLILVSTTLYVDLVHGESELAPRFGDKRCWFDSGFSLLVFFVGPVCAILILNFVFFLHTSYILHSNQCESANQKSCMDYKLFTRIGLLTGFTWIIGFIAGFTQNVVVWCIFVVLNTAQGIFIFTAFSCKKRVFQSLMKRFNFEKCQKNVQQKNTASKGSTTSTRL